ncbi:MAG: GNAT family N-acetyltransferase [Pseudomonadota bacterium]
MNVTLSEIDPSNFEDVIALELEPAQELNLPTNVYSIAESSLSDMLHPRAICVDGIAVGFVMYAVGDIDDEDGHTCTIWRFMVDRRHQGQGIGKIAMGLVLSEIRARHPCQMVEIYYGAENVAARKVYALHGFKDVGRRDDGDIIAERSV